MRLASFRMVFSAGLLVALAGMARAQVIADLRGDFLPGAAQGNTTRTGQNPQGLPDAGGTGFWNYYTSDTSDPATWKLTPLTWDRTWKPVAANSDLKGYVKADNPRHIGNVTGGEPAVHEEAAPAEGFCGMHPSAAPGAVVAEWTSNTTGAHRVSGTVKMAQANKESGVQFCVVKLPANGAPVVLTEIMTITDADPHPFTSPVDVAVGDKIYIMLGPNGSIWGDHTHVAAKIAKR